MQGIDLHSHSHFSDGTLSPSELLAHAKAQDVHMLALTDHDTLDGLPEAQTAADIHGIQLVHGVEVSSQWHKPNKKNPFGVHILALAPKDMQPLQALLQQQQQVRAIRAQEICHKLSKLIQRDPWQEVLAMTHGRADRVTRAHIASWLVSQHIVSKPQQAFDRYLKEGKRAFVPLAWADMPHVVEVIRHSGAQAVLAHPTRYNLSATHVRYLIGLFKSVGGHAVELPASHEPPATRGMIDYEIAQHNLMVSISSDFHGDNMPWIKLGRVPTPKPEQVGVWTAF